LPSERSPDPSLATKELAMNALGFLVLCVCLFVFPLLVALLIWRKMRPEIAKTRQFYAELREHLPPEVRAEEPAPLGTTIGAVIVAVFGIMISIRSIRPPYASPALGMMIILACAAVLVVMWIKRSRIGDVLVDLSPLPLPAFQRNYIWMIALPVVFLALVDVTLSSHRQWTDWLLPACYISCALVMLMGALMQSDRVWIARRGLYISGWLYAWERVEGVAWSDYGRAFALRRTGPLVLKRWLLVPVPGGSRESAEAALRQFVPRPSPVA
jgi:hypothetical protein